MKREKKALRIGTLFLCVLLLMIVSVVPALAETDERHRSWTEEEAEQSITPEEVQELIAVPAERVRVLWSVEYGTEEYPVIVTLRASGTDGLPIYVFEYVGEQWILLGEGTGPELEVPVNEGGSLSLAVTLSEKTDRPEDGTAEATAEAEETESPVADKAAERPRNGGIMWLMATGAITVIAIFGALTLTKHKEH